MSTAADPGLRGAPRERPGKALIELISQTQGVRALMTSQAPLNIAGETVYRLAALPVPRCRRFAADAVQCAAVALFAQRAAAADRRFELVRGEHSDRCPDLPPAGWNPAGPRACSRPRSLAWARRVLERLDDRFRLLKPRASNPIRGIARCIRRLTGAMACPLLAEQRVFNRLGAFAGSFSLKAGARCVADESSTLPRRWI